ncbi:sulfite reductase flavoprotein subunit alpha [Vibrio nigripulchritudo]|uniref:sulfite reductase flavoprotein subunit alpha n=1 Tax=Vibrio nigripulchritudo TaxID=28173 RepID=UPI00248FA59C|nr:sulfite reductase flavoprotein subunit alpha [Vibrio nigripulchritudo]BDU39220.1 sulfite reductase [NADPH] flavoprotein alpha-component [Vibrio nigripulchritudo]BDU44940.1 sulfite reductase [NADPH] flavoprotein alpha-component [Vibrio nigripulchritudo]
MQSAIQSMYVVYGSVSGNAKELASQLFSDSELAQRFDITLKELDEFDPSSINENTFVAFITSSFGDGEPPGNAELFWQKFQEITSPLTFSFGVFGLGDTAYPNFCGFSKGLDNALTALGAKRLINRVDADLNYPPLFKTWKSTLKSVLLENNTDAGLSLDISVTSYGEDSAYQARLLSVSQLTATFPCLYRFTLNIEGSGIQYQPGDIVHLVPTNQAPLLTPFAEFFSVPLSEVQAALASKEIARISKATLRKLTQKYPNNDLKALLKHRNKAALTEYLKRHQIIDLLRDFYPPEAVTLEELSLCLSGIEPRTYSIASSQLADTNTLDICVREVWSDPENAEPRPGCATAYLHSLEVGDQVPLFVRSNPSFHFDMNVPSVLIATGAGIAPFIGYLQARERTQPNSPCILFFGEKYQDKDFAYKDEIGRWLKSGTLQNSFVAFSRDNDSKVYVQDSVNEHQDLVNDFIDQGAHVYVCGRKQNLATEIEPMMNRLSEQSSDNRLQTLTEAERLHLDLF